MLSYESMPAGQFVFEEGDEGSLFYVILKGSVAVCIKEQQVLLQSNLREGIC